MTKQATLRLNGRRMITVSVKFSVTYTDLVLFVLDCIAAKKPLSLKKLNEDLRTDLYLSGVKHHEYVLEELYDWYNMESTKDNLEEDLEKAKSFVDKHFIGFSKEDKNHLKGSIAYIKEGRSEGD